MSLSLDPRQRAMLREMGVRVWLPAGPVVAIKSGASNQDNTRAIDHFHEDKPVARSALDRPAPQVFCAPAPTPSSAAPADAEQAAWRLGTARALYPQAAPRPGARWLVLAETSPAALDADPLQGDAGRLLDNMLRAARMNDSGSVLLAPLVRLAASGPTADFSAALAVLLARHQPDLVLVMGRLAAQAVLRSSEPFGKLRGQLHSLHGATAVVTYDAAYLLHHPADKARAWEDLCLAISLARAA